MKPAKKYYLIFLPVVTLELVVAMLFNISLSHIVSFSIAIFFAMFLEHPDINIYKKSTRRRLAFVSILFYIKNLADEFVPRLSYKKAIVRNLPGFLFTVLIAIVSSDFNILVSFVFGVVNFEVILYFYNSELL